MSGWDRDVVWKEWVGQRCGLEGVGGMKIMFGRSGCDEVIWEEWVG